ncbi:CPSF A subunit region [Colletotrichum costaricense]|uniref:CPSF A subunit region n=1 Tax=Colletotrichum costaricense TaxID=1209916 RepID=A0AAI9Z044_9PEZI|nr:CPSF A subunit region [Colletotrichum costaricense]KAK1529008.1 CPSF A subunit region [Colletotrichum costaricense]
MQCYTELTPPTGVQYSLSLPFISAQSNNLVVARGSLIQIFSTKTISSEVDTSQTREQQASRAEEPYDRRLNDDDGLESSFLGGDGMLVRADRSNNTKLVLVAEFPIFGIVTGLARIKLQHSKSGGEALLIATRVARLSLVQWDPEKHALEDISIHYYEKEELEGSPFDGPLNNYRTYLAADPGSRCAALRFGPRYIAFLPFKQVDEDIDMDDWDEDVDGPRPAKEPSAAAATNGTSNIADVPYSTSYVLPLPQLDPSLLHPVHLAFLHEYREPTFGIISSTQRRSHTLPRKDHFSYKVFTLDLQQRASTAILSVNNLPQDLFKVIALPGPVGGALLVGTNELIHIDQSGKPNGVAVNAFTKETTNFPLADQSDLDLRLENCYIELMSAENGELLMVLSDGRLAIITFKIDGRTVSGVSVKLVPAEVGGNVVQCSVSSISKLSKNVFFLGTTGSDSLVLGWTRKQAQNARKKTRLVDDSFEYDLDDEDMDDGDDDDLYGETTTTTIQHGATANGVSKGGDLSFRIHDSLLSIAPIKDMVSGKQAFVPDSEEEKNSIGVVSDLQLACAVGKGNAGAVAIMNQNIQPKVIGKFEFPEARGFWTMCVQKPIPKSLQGDKGANAAVGSEFDASSIYDKFMIVSKVDLDGYETSDVYALTGAGFEALSGTEFDPAAGFTVEAGTMGKHLRIIQVLKSEVRCYDGDLGLSQILPMLDEDTGAEPRVISASIVDPYLLLIRDDSSIMVAQIDSNCELEEMEREDDTFLSTKWLAGCLYKDTHDLFGQKTKNEATTEDRNIFMFLLSAAGALYIYALPDLSKPVYVAAGLTYVPPFLSADYAVRRGTVQETLTEILMADLGDATATSPHLILRHANDDLTIYEPIRLTKQDESVGLAKTLHFRKVNNPSLAKSPVEVADDDANEQPRFVPLRACSDINGYSTVFLPGASPSFIIKSAKSSPKVVGLQGIGVRGMSSFHTEGCERGFIYADSEGQTRVTQLPTDANFAELGVSVRKIPVGDAVGLIAYHPPMETYAVACSVSEVFELPKDDDYHKEWAKETTIIYPRTERGIIKLMSPTTWSVIDTVELEQHEVAMCMKTLHLEVSEETKERRMLITIGTAINRGEDLPIRGRILVYDVVPVVPQPGRPETNKKLKLVAKEEIPRGAVTAICEVGSQGLMLVAQGQKCMVRGLKEDGTLLPVAFMDMNCYVTAVREVRGTGYCLMTDAFKGVWFVGYAEEPYKMMLFGKSAGKFEVSTADFVVAGDELHIVVCDKDGVIHVMQFDPEHPKSLQGHLLLNRASFSAAPNHPTATLSLPRTSASPSPANASKNPPTTLLLASPTGALASLNPLGEQAYRRLTSLANSIAGAVPQAAATNPKAHRLQPLDARTPGVDTSAGRSIVDGALLARWNELGAGRRFEVAGKGGYGDVLEVRGELEGVLGWSGMAYF